MNIEYLENRRNLPSDGVMFLAMKQGRHQNAMPTVCVDTCGNIWSQRFALFPRNLYRNALETAVLSAVFPDGAPQSKGKIRKRQRNPLKGWKLQLIRNLAEAPRSKGTPLKLHRKQAMRHLLCSDMLKFRRKLWAMDERNWAWSH